MVPIIALFIHVFIVKGTRMMADQPARYDSPPESIETRPRDDARHQGGAHQGRRRKLSRPIRRHGLGRDEHAAAQNRLAGHGYGERYDLLAHALKESIWSLEKADSKELAFEFVKEEARQAMPGFRADAFDALTTRLEALGKEQTALAEKFGEFASEAYPLIAKLAEVRPAASLDAFDRVVADLRRHWHEDGHGDGGETWEEQSAVEKIGYLAGHAAAHNVSFERFTEAAARTLDLASPEEFTSVEVQHLRHQIRWAHGDYANDPAWLSPDSAPKDRLAFIAATADERDGMPAPEEWRKLQAEWTHDYGLRRMEDRGVSYEDESERPLDHTAGGGKAEGQKHKREVSPADLTESTGPTAQQGQQQKQSHGISM